MGYTQTLQAMKNTLLLSLLFLFTVAHLHAQNNSLTAETIIYKQIDTTQLVMKVYYPPSMDTTQTYPAMVYYSGGGWSRSNLKQFEPHAKYFANRGIICFLADYRAKHPHGTTIKECVIDAKSSIRYIRENANRLHVDRNKIIAAGGSAGGQLAMATSFVVGYDDPHDNLEISPKPNALVLYNPAIDIGPGVFKVYGLEGEVYKDVLPIHNIKPGAPPTIIMVGTEDQYILKEMLDYYQLIMNMVNSRCDIHRYEGQKHGFFNLSVSEKNYKQTVLDTDKFLISLGYINGEPTILKDE